MSEGKKDGYSKTPEKEDNRSVQANPDLEEYRFVKEVIKEKPLDKRKLLFYAAVIVISAIIFGIIAAFTFAKVLPLFTRAENTSEKGQKIAESDYDTEEGAEGVASGKKDSETNAQDKEATDGSSEDKGGSDSVNHTDNTGETDADKDSEDIAAADSEDDGENVKEGTDGEEEQESGSAGTQTADTEALLEMFLTQEDFEKYFAEIRKSVTEMEKCLVTVRGITSDVDWMNNSYEDEKQISGILVENNGKEYFVLTEYRVVDQVDRILVSFADGNSVDAHFQKQDPGTGLAVLKISASDIDVATKNAIAIADFDTGVSVKRGQQVIALGSPAGYSGAMSGGMITSVSNMKGSLDNEFHVLTTDIVGDSGGSGILMDMNGNIAGMILQSFSIENNKNIVTALPVRELKERVSLLVGNQDIIYLGIRGQDIDSDLMDKTGIPKGIFVNAVEEDSPAMESGIQNGDVIVKIGETTVDTLEKMRRQLNKYKPEQKIRITAMRKGAEGYVEIVFDVTLGAL